MVEWECGNEISEIPLTVKVALLLTDPASHSYTPASLSFTSRMASLASFPDRLTKYFEEFQIKQPSLYQTIWHGFEVLHNSTKLPPSTASVSSNALVIVGRLSVIQRGLLQRHISVYLCCTLIWSALYFLMFHMFHFMIDNKDKKSLHISLFKTFLF